MLIFDPKRDVIPLLKGIAPDSDIIITHPFDKRGAAWDISADCNEPRVAIELAFTLIPSYPESQPFFSDASRHLLAGVLISYMWRKLPFSFADVLRALSSARLMRRVLLACPHTRQLVGSYFYDKKLVGNILSTIATRLLAFQPIAACWETATEKFSISEWITSERILVLGSSEISANTFLALNSALFKRACDVTLDQNDSKTKRSWFVIDEVSDAGKLPGLGSLAKKGRSKGASIVLAFQSIEGLRHPGTQEPLIDRATWDRVQTLLGNQNYSTHLTTYGSELITCAHCGHPITGEVKTKLTKAGPKDYVYYRCARYTKPGHPRTRIPEADFDRQILALFDKMRIEDEEVRDWFRAVLRSQTKDRQAESQAMRHELQRQQTLLAEQQDRLLNMRLADDVDQATYARKSTEIRDRLASIKLQLDAVDRSRDEMGELASKVFELSQVLREKWLASDCDVKRRILEIVCLNFSLVDATLVPTIRKPFDVLLVQSSRGDKIRTCDLLLPKQSR